MEFNLDAFRILIGAIMLSYAFYSTIIKCFKALKALMMHDVFHATFVWEVILMTFAITLLFLP